MKNHWWYVRALKEASRARRARDAIQLGIPMTYERHPDTPDELWASICEFWPDDQWGNASWVAYLESGFDAFAVADTTDPTHPCGVVIGDIGGVPVTAERSVGYFQINTCNFTSWEWQRLYNARHNAGTAHMLWDEVDGSWKPWFFTAQALGLT